MMNSRLIVAVTRCVALAGSVTSVGAAAIADPLGDVKSAAIATMNAGSYHFTMSTPGVVDAEGDMKIPVSLREKMSNGMEMIVLPSASYMKMNGKWSKFVVWRDGDVL